MTLIIGTAINFKGTAMSNRELDNPYTVELCPSWKWLVKSLWMKITKRHALLNGKRIVIEIGDNGYCIRGFEGERVSYAGLKIKKDC